MQHMSRTTTTTTRKCLADMEPQELRHWLLERQKRLVTHKRFVQRDLNRRRVHYHGKRTYAERQYSRFQVLADDLLELLEGVVTNIDQQMQCATSKEGTL